MIMPGYFFSTVNWISPGSSDTGDYNANPLVNDGSKVIILDTDHIPPVRDGRANMGPWIWKCFMHGHNIMLMDTLTATYNGVDMVAARRVLEDTQNYARKIDLAAMTPSESSFHCSTTYCLRNPGQEHFIYQPNSGAFTVNLAAGTYDYEWFNPNTGTVVKTGTITAIIGNRSFILPFSDDALLFLSISGNSNPAAIFGTKDACSK